MSFKKKIRKMTAMLLTVGMLTSLMPQNFAFAAEQASETDATEQETSEEKTGEVTSAFDKTYAGVDTTGLDFSSCELLIATEDTSIFTADTEVVSEYDGVYLTRYPDAETAKNAYTYYYDKADLVDVNSVIKASENGDENKTEDEEEQSSDDEDVPQQKETDKTEPSEEVADEDYSEADMSNLNKGDDAIANLNDVDFDETTDEKNPYKGFIALIDTGAKKEGIVKEAVSLIGDETDDDNGHGTDMVKAITDANKDAKVISVKALNKDGKGNVSDVYAAIKYAIELKVSVINLSMASVKSAESQILEDVINEATDNGIIVVASAGNNGKDAKYYTPANVEKAYTIGACDEEGKLLKTSNSGKVVDYYVVADSTSEAAAKFSAYAAKDFKNVKNNENVFTKLTKEEDKETKDDKETEDKDAIDDEEILTDDSAEDIEIKVNSKKVSDLTWYGLGNHDGYELRRSNNQGHTGADNNRTWWYLGWYNSSNYIKWSAKAYCLDYNKAAPPNLTQQLSSLLPYTDTDMVKAFFWSKADLAQYYVDGNTIYEYDDPRMEGTYALYNMNYGGMTDTATSDLLRYAAGNPIPRNPTPGKADYDRVTGYSFPSEKAKYVKWSEMKSAVNEPTNPSATLKTNADWYLEPNFTDIFIVKAKEGGLSTGSFSTLSASDWEWRQTNQDYHTKNYIKFSGGEDNLAMFIGYVPANSTYVVHCSDNTTTTTYNTGSKFVMYSGDSLEIYTSKTNGVETLSEAVRDNHAYGFYVSIATYNDSTQRMGYLNGVQGTAAELSYNLPSKSYLGFRKEIKTQSGTTTYDTADDIWFEVYDGDGANANFLGYMVTGDDSPTNKGVAWYVKDGDKHKINGDGAVGVQAGTTVYLYECGKWNNTYNTYVAPKDLTNAEVKLENTTTQLKSRKGYYKKFTLNTVNETTWKAMTAANIPKVSNTTTPTTVTLTKTSSAPAYSNNNPNYSLKNTEFTVYKTKSGETLSNEVGKITVNEDGTASKLQLDTYMNRVNDQMVKTTFYVKETKAGKGYELDTSIDTIEVNPQEAKSFSKTNKPGNDLVNLTIQKLDETGNTTLNGNTTLAGAEFTVKFYPQDVTGDFDSSKAAAQTWVFQTKEKPGSDPKTFYLEFNKSFFAPSCTNMTYIDTTTGQLDVPYGFVTIEETKAPQGFKTNGDFSIKTSSGSTVTAANGIMIFKITDSGEQVKDSGTGTYHAVDENGKAVKNDAPIRADVWFEKVDENGDPMENVKFSIKAVDPADHDVVIQEVTVVTDENGKFSTESSYAKHADNTNAGVAKCGTWFGDTTNIKENLGALYAGDYIITELRCDANKGKQLETPFPLTVDETVDGQVIKIFDQNASDNPDQKITNVPAPRIHTDAVNNDTGTKTMGQPGAEPDNTVDYTNQTIKDDVYYENLLENTHYMLLAEIMVVDLETLTVTPYEEEVNGQKVPYKRIQPLVTSAGYERSRFEKTDHVTVMLDHIDGTGLEGKKLVVYETLYLNEKGLIQTVDDIPDDDKAEQYTVYGNIDHKAIELDYFPLRHNDPDDDKQTITVADTHTTTMGKDTGDHIGPSGTETFTDRVFYTGLTPGVTYKVSGVVHLKTDDDAKTSSDESILKDKDGKPVTAEKEFVPTDRNGFVDLEFKIDAAALVGQRIVCFEDILEDKLRIAFHADIHDEDEFYYIPEIHTTTRNSQIDASKITDKNKDSAKEIKAAEGESFIDTILYKSLLCNRTYHIKGVLMDKATGEVMKDAAGKEIKAETTYKTKEVSEVKVTTSPDAVDYMMADGTVLDMSADHANYLANGTIDLKFEGYDFTTLANKVGVVYEEVYLVTQNADGTTTENLVAEHKDIKDVDQFTYFVEMGTTAKDTTTGIKTVPQNVQTIVEDTVNFKNAIVGKEYTMSASFRVKNDKSGTYKDGDTLLGKDGKPVTAEVKFKPTTKDGSVVVKIPLDSSVLKDMQLVVFEDMKNEFGISIGSHFDLSDEEQTVKIPHGRTTATSEDGKKSVATSQKVIIYDTLKYSNMEVGVEFTAKGTIYVKETGEPLKDASGNPITSTVKFTPTSPDGEVKIPFEIDTASLGLGGKTLVVFEDVLYKETTIFVEHEIDNADQSITVTPPTPRTTPPKTGMIIFFILLGFIAVGGAGMLVTKRKKIR